MGVGESRNERFYHFCGLGKAHLVEKMLEADRIHKTININWQLFESKCTPLLIAAANGHDKVVEILLQNGADVKATDERFCTALHHAAQRGHSKIIEMLLKSGCDVNAQDKNNWSPLMNACYWAHRDAVVHLLRAGANPSLVNSDGRNVLLELCRSPSRNEEALAEIAHVLIETGTSVDIKASAKFHSFKEDFTALMYAAYHNHARIASVLIESNCNLNIQDYQGWTALHWSVDRDNTEVVQLLIDKGCHIDIKGYREESALDRAKSDSVRNILLQHASFIENDSLKLLQATS